MQSVASCAIVVSAWGRSRVLFGGAKFAGLSVQHRDVSAARMLSHRCGFTCLTTFHSQLHRFSFEFKTSTLVLTILSECCDGNKQPSSIVCRYAAVYRCKFVSADNFGTKPQSTRCSPSAKHKFGSVRFLSTCPMAKSWPSYAATAASRRS